MGNIAYYLKYRPQTLQELMGQEAVKKTLLSSFQNNKLSHAYLFVGPRGTGKTSTARILAKMVNCEKKSSVHQSSIGTGRQSSDKDKKSLIAESEAILKTNDYPCNKCATCISITDGSNLDLIEIDAASNRGIEDIRSLREKIKLSPSSLKKKVYIIDEAHMLTTEAFNALLKTLEEPPAHVLFILATTELGKIPQTILSRVQRLDFKLAAPGEISAAFEKIIQEEQIDIEPEAFKLLVKKAEGSFRDGIKLLDQVSAAKVKVTIKYLQENLQSTPFDDLVDLVKDLFRQDSAKSLLNVSGQLEHGADVRELTLSLMDTLRNLMLIKNKVGGQLVKPQLTEDKYEQMVILSENLSGRDLVKALDILQKALEKLKFASIPSLPLELAVVEICTSFSVIATPDLIRGKQSSPEEIPTKIALSSTTEVGTPRNDDASSSRRQEEVEKVLKGEDSHSNKEQSEFSTVSSDSLDIFKLKEKWTFVLETVRSFNYSLEALLRSISIRKCTENTVILEVPYSFHQRILEAPKNRDLLEGVFSDVLGRGIRVSTALGSRPERREDIANLELAADDEIIRAAAEIFNSDTVN